MTFADLEFGQDVTLVPKDSGGNTNRLIVTLTVRRKRQDADWPNRDELALTHSIGGPVTTSLGQLASYQHDFDWWFSEKDWKVKP